MPRDMHIAGVQAWVERGLALSLTNPLTKPQTRPCLMTTDSASLSAITAQLVPTVRVAVAVRLGLDCERIVLLQRQVRLSIRKTRHLHNS